MFGFRRSGHIYYNVCKLLKFLLHEYLSKKNTECLQAHRRGTETVSYKFVKINVFVKIASDGHLNLTTSHMPPIKS